MCVCVCVRIIGDHRLHGGDEHGELPGDVLRPLGQEAPVLLRQALALTLRRQHLLRPHLDAV